MATRKLRTVSSNQRCVRHKSTKGYLLGRLRHLKLLSSPEHRSNSSALFLTARPRSILHKPIPDYNNTAIQLFFALCSLEKLLKTISDHITIDCRHLLLHKL